MTGVPFAPCLTSPGNCPLAKDSRHVRFHRHERALSFALGRAHGAGKPARYRVYFDGAHWRTVNLATRDEV